MMYPRPRKEDFKKASKSQKNKTKKIPYYDPCDKFIYGTIICILSFMLGFSTLFHFIK